MSKMSLCRSCVSASTRWLSTSSLTSLRFGVSDGASGWKWDKGGVGMGGKDRDVGSAAKAQVGKGKAYQSPEYFSYDKYSFHDVEKAMESKRVPQPKSGLSEFW